MDRRPPREAAFYLAQYTSQFVSLRLFLDPLTCEIQNLNLSEYRRPI
jgi:hypothetical protein